MPSPAVFPPSILIWAFPDALEAPLICRLAVDGASSELQQRWREQVLPALAGDDVALMEQLWDPVLGPMEEVVASLLEYAASRAWTAPSLRAMGLDAAWHEPRPGKHGLPSLPPERLLPVWAAGALSASVERGMELHPAALAVLERDEEVRHRLWRGQVRLILPVIDALRLRACQEITDEMGDTWPLAYTTPNSRAEVDEVRDNPLNCQLGHLEHLLQRSELRRWRPRWMGVIRCARAARNKLAHCQPVEFADFHELMTEAQRIGALTALPL